MEPTQRKALESVRGYLNWASSLDDVWDPKGLHVAGLNDVVLDEMMAAFGDADRHPLNSPLGVVLRGPAGSGKTHMLGQLRERVLAGGGYFFIVQLLDASTFWESVRAGIVNSLGRPGARQGTQLRGLLWELASLAHVPRAVRKAIAGDNDLTPDDLDRFVSALGAVNREVVRECRHTLRALVLSGSPDFDLLDLGDAYLNGTLDSVAAQQNWGLPSNGRGAQETVADIAKIVALVGPMVLAVDQIDALLAQSRQRTEQAGGPTDNRDLEHVAHGLMSIRENMRRTVGVVALLPAAWESIRQRAVASVQDRFRETSTLQALPTPEIGRSILEQRFTAGYGAVGFQPPYPTWPIRAAAFGEAPDYTPRRLLMRADEHLRSCIAIGEISELDRLGTGESSSKTSTTEIRLTTGELGTLDARFTEYRARAVTAAALDPEGEDSTVPELFNAALHAWITERPGGESDFQVDPKPGAKPMVHARLRQSLDAAADDERHWAFRAIASGSAIAVQSRIRNACVATGLAAGLDRRELVLLRNTPWPRGPKTAAMLAEFGAAGGRTMTMSDDDLRTLIALRDLLAENPPNLLGWLTVRRPAHGIEVLRQALGDQAGPAPTPVDVVPVPDSVVAERIPDDKATPAPIRLMSPTAVPLGTDEAGAERTVDLMALRKHAVVFAGSGSGKTVLLRRIIEECALRGVSSIVLDVNNDLSRLGNAWPQQPTGWDPADTARAQEYLTNTEVVVWTPNKQGGRPLSFQPLPDFESVLDDPDEYTEAVESALGALEPRMGVTGARAKRARAVLKEALQWYGRQPEAALAGFVDVLRDLPDEASTLDGRRLAGEIAMNLRAEMINDDMFGGSGEPADPAVLLTPSPGYRARVSVISMIGLVNERQREGFVNQLQMALFSWIKRHPAGDRPLSGLLVMDEAQNFAPSRRSTISLRSTQALSSQARKYGLGLLFATQQPKGLDPSIPGNAATQFFGFLNSPVQIATAMELARLKGGEVRDISRLQAGQFYAAVEGEAFHKLKTPWCLSHHASSPPTTEEVLELSRQGHR